MTRRPAQPLRRALPLAGLLALGAVPGPLPGQNADGVMVDGSHLLQVPADRVRIALQLAAAGDSPQAALAALQSVAAQLDTLLDAAGAERPLLFIADAPPTPAVVPASGPSAAGAPAAAAPAAGTWTVVREIRTTLPIAGSSRLLDALAARPGVTVTEVLAELGDRERVRQQAIERATADAAGKALAAARQLGYTVGAVREIRVTQSEQPGPASIGLEAKVSVRYALVPASTRSEVLAIAATATAAPRASATGAETPAASTSAASTSAASTSAANTPAALAVEIVAASYDATGRGRFTTAVGTVWREVVPTPREQRLVNGRRYAGTVSAGVFGGFRMQLTGVPRILKVEPVSAPQPPPAR